MVERDADRLYQAMMARDPRFDGRFFVGVRTTGVYCRSICPAPTPKRANCRFFASAAAAQSAGFRPCKRCRPETAPASPAWSGTEATVRRALRLIADGALDDATVGALAIRLGVGERHLRRLFDTHLGASPAAVARTQRLHLAKQLLERTDLPMADVALAAGFGSVRRFNDQVRQVYGAPPGSLRRDHGRRTGGVAPVELRLGCRPPFDWPALAGFLAARAIPGLETCTQGYRRSIRLGPACGVLDVSPGPGGALTARLRLDGAAPLLAAVAGIRSLFDIDADTAGITAHLAADRRLAPLVARAPGLRVPGAWDAFELAVRAVLGQQVTVAGARTLLGRLVATHGDPLPGADGQGAWRLFPEAGRLAEADLTAIGLTRARAATVRGLAAAAASGDLCLDPADDPDEAMRRLRALPGIGAWTAGYIAMRALRHPDAFPSADAGLVKAARRLGIAETARGLDDAAEAWRPWRAYAAIHLWHSLSDSEPRHAVFPAAPVDRNRDIADRRPAAGDA